MPIQNEYIYISPLTDAPNIERSKPKRNQLFHDLSILDFDCPGYALFIAFNVLRFNLSP
jgi:hypothetical protein